MNKQRKASVIVILLLLTMALSACGVSAEDYSALESERDDLKKEVQGLNVKTVQLEAQNKELATKLDELENGPDRLLSQMKLEYEDENYSKLKSIYKEFKDNHFASPLFEEAQIIYDDVIAIEEAAAEAKRLEAEKLKEERLAALDSLDKDEDDISGITWYKQSYFTHYTNSNRTSIYIGEQSNNVWLRLKMSYTGDDWIFFEKAYLSYDGNTLEVPFDEYENYDSDVMSNADVAEWIDIQVTSDIRKFLRDFAEAEEPKMRLTGKYEETRSLTWNEIQGIKDVLNGYDALKEDL